MTLPTSTRVTDPYETDGVQRDFEFDFPAFYNADTGHYGIEVRRLTALDYEVIDKSLYDIFLNDEDKSGYIRFHVAPMAGDDIYIAGDTTRSQQLNLINYGRYSAQSIEKAFDLIVALIQEFVSKVDEETRQRILADQALRDFLLIKFNQFTAEVTTKIDKHIGDINGFMSSLIPMFVCIMRKEIANYAETQLDGIIDAKLSDLSIQVANAINENDAALIRLNESILKIDAATTATAIGARLFDTPAAGVHPVTGVPVGAYFNVRSPNAESYVDEYRNVGGVPTPSGKTYPSGAALAEVEDAIIDPVTGKAAASKVFNSSGTSLQQLYDIQSAGGLSVFAFFTPAALAAYLSNKDAFDAKTQLQAFFDFISSTNVGTAYCSGDFATSVGIKFGGASGSKTKFVHGNFNLRALNAIDMLFLCSAGQDLQWNGLITMQGTGSTSFVSRTCRVGFSLGTGTEVASRNKFQGITARNFYETGISVPQLGSLSSLGYLRASDCGSGYSGAGYSLKANFSNVVNTGSINSVGQRSVITVDTLPPSNLDSTRNPLLVLIAGQTYYVYSIDSVAKTLSVFPWVDNTITSGELTYDFGGGVLISGGDSSVLGVSMIDAVRCSRAYVGTALYAPNIDRIVSQFNGTAVLLGQNPSAAHVGGIIGNLYCENNDRDMTRVTRAQLSLSILSNTAFDFNKIRYTSAPRSGTNVLGVYDNLSGIEIQNNGLGVTYQRPRATENSSPTFNVTSESDADFIYYGNTANLIIAAPDLNLYNMFGRFKRRVVVYGSGAGGKPTTVNFSLADAVNYTIDSTGVTTKTITGFDGFAVFDIIYRDDSKRFFISQVSNKDRSATLTYDPPSLAAGASTTTTVPLTGVSLGAVVQAGFSQYNADIEISASVSAANTVTVKFKNTGAAPVDLASGILTVKSI